MKGNLKARRALPAPKKPHAPKKPPHPEKSPAPTPAKKHTQKEVDRNYEKFSALLPTILKTHAGKFALMHDGEIVEYYTTFEDACVTGDKFFKSGNYSVQEVTDVPVDLGFFSRAGC